MSTTADKYAIKVQPGMKVAYDAIQGLVYGKIVSAEPDRYFSHRVHITILIEKDAPGYRKGQVYTFDGDKVVSVKNIRHTQYSTYIAPVRWIL